MSNDKKKKEKTINILKECYDNDLYNSFDLKEISKDTDTEIEVNDYMRKSSIIIIGLLLYLFFEIQNA